MYVRFSNGLFLHTEFQSQMYMLYLHCRGVVAADANFDPGDGGDSLEDVTTDGPVMFCHDPRLQLPSFVYHTPEQVRDLIACTYSGRLCVSFPTHIHIMEVAHDV